jgi:hypothetical protein
LFKINPLLAPPNVAKPMAAMPMKKRILMEKLVATTVFHRSMVLSWSSK